MTLDKQQLLELYVDKGLSCIEVSKQLGCCQGLVSRYLKRYDIKARNFSRSGFKPWNYSKTKKNDTRIKTPKTAFKEGQIPWNKI